MIVIHEVMQSGLANNFNGTRRHADPQIARSVDVCVIPKEAARAVNEQAVPWRNP
jgi:hypothetical protein